MSQIHEKTLVPIGIAVMVIGSATWWLATQASVVSASAKEIERNKIVISINQASNNLILNRLDRRIFEIQIKLGMKPKNDGDE